MTTTRTVNGWRVRLTFERAARHGKGTWRAEAEQPGIPQGGERPRVVRAFTTPRRRAAWRGILKLIEDAACGA